MSLSAQLDFKVTITNATNNVKKLNKQNKLDLKDYIIIVIVSLKV